MKTEQTSAKPCRSSVLLRFFLMLSGGIVCLLFSIQAFFRSMLCFCPSQFLATAGLFIGGAGLIIYSIYMLVEDKKLRQLSLKIDSEE